MNHSRQCFFYIIYRWNTYFSCKLQNRNLLFPNDFSPVCISLCHSSLLWEICSKSTWQCDHISKMAENSQQPLPKRHDLQTSADLERVTDYAEEKEISTTDIENVSSVLFRLWRQRSRFKSKVKLLTWSRFQARFRSSKVLFGQFFISWQVVHSLIDILRTTLRTCGENSYAPEFCIVRSDWSIIFFDLHSLVHATMQYMWI